VEQAGIPRKAKHSHLDLCSGFGPGIDLGSREKKRNYSTPVPAAPRNASEKWTDERVGSLFVDSDKVFFARVVNDELVRETGWSASALARVRDKAKFGVAHCSSPGRPEKRPNKDLREKIVQEMKDEEYNDTELANLIRLVSRNQHTNRFFRFFSFVFFFCFSFTWSSEPHACPPLQPVDVVPLMWNVIPRKAYILIKI
jgi:hypothetical protein